MASQCLLRLALLLILGLITKAHAEEPEPIVGGQLVAVAELPYQVYLKVFGQFNCGGALITSQHVLTAAHCVDRVVVPEQDIVVVTGSVDLYHGEVHNVKSIYSHPQFVRSTKSSYAHDIAIIMLQKRIKITALQKPIRIATKETEPGAHAIISGWGRTRSRDPVSYNLLKVGVTVTSQDYCNEVHRPIIYPSQICTSDRRGIGFCGGDSGGPLVYNNELIGLVSWSFGCASGRPDVYTKVYYYRSFIYDILDRSQHE